MLVTVSAFLYAKRSRGNRLRKSTIQQVAINHQVIILEHIEDYLDIAACCFLYSLTVDTAISAALCCGNPNTPVEIQQNAMLSHPFSSASFKQER